MAALEVNCRDGRGSWCVVIKTGKMLTAGERLDIVNLPANATDFLWIESDGSKHLPTEIFDQIPNLKGISLSVGIEKIQQSDFTNAGHLQSLSIPRNVISDLPADVFAKAANLESIEIDDSNVTEIKDFAFRGLDKLKRIRLGGNQIRVIRRNTFAGAPNLREIVLGNNEIDTIEDGAFDLPKLRALYLDSNQLKNLPVDLFSKTPSLSLLNLEKNPLDGQIDALSKPHNITHVLSDTESSGSRRVTLLRSQP